MGRFGGRQLRAAFALVGCVGIGLAAMGGSAGGEDRPPPTFETGPFPPDAGVLHLHLGAEDFLRLDTPSGTGYAAGTPQPLVASGCLLGDPRPSLITFATTLANSKVGFTQDALGIQARREGNGTSCGQVNGSGDALVVKLPTGSGHVIDFAELDVEGKFTVTILAELRRAGAVVQTESISFTGSDSGPDSSSRDNRRWRVGTPAAGGPDDVVLFDEIRLSVSPSTPGGAFSLEGGADGTDPGAFGASLVPATADTLFHLVRMDGVLECGGPAVTEGDGTTVPQASISLVSEPGCEAVAYNLEVDVTEDGWKTVLFQKAADGDEHFLVTIRWTPEDELYPIPPTQIDYGDGPLDLVWCDVDEAGEPVQNPAQPWCLTSHHADLTDDGQMQLVETLLGTGDPISFR